jgi:hypothetical protein
MDSLLRENVKLHDYSFIFIITFSFIFTLIGVITWILFYKKENFNK